MTPPDRLLYPIFEALRVKGVPLGVSEYTEAVETIRTGYHLESPERLCRLLCLLWAKSRDDLTVVAAEFRDKVAPLLKPVSQHQDDDGGESKTGADRVEHQAQVLVLAQEARKQSVTEALFEGRRLTAPDRTVPDHPGFRMTPRPPLNLRDAARALRRYCQPIRVGISDKIDVDATVDKICRDRYFTRPAFRPLIINRAELLLMVDRGGSMTPFSIGVESLLKAVRNESRIRRPQVYYFHDCPEAYLFKTPGLSQPIKIGEALTVPRTGLGILIVSDAGAARGDFDRKRVEKTEAFLNDLKRITPRMAWLNPVPPHRWAMSTASEINQLSSPMFPLTREGLEDAVKVLRGHPVPGVGAHAR